MKKRVKANLIFGGITLLIVLLLFLPIKKSPLIEEEEIIKCIGEKSTLYVQLGCLHCEKQEEFFGDYVSHIKIIDCFYETEKCDGIEGTPTWKIGLKTIQGIQTIEELRELTDC